MVTESVCPGPVIWRQGEGRGEVPRGTQVWVWVNRSEQKRWVQSQDWNARPSRTPSILSFPFWLFGEPMTAHFPKRYGRNKELESEATYCVPEWPNEGGQGLTLNIPSDYYVRRKWTPVSFKALNYCWVILLEQPSLIISNIYWILHFNYIFLILEIFKIFWSFLLHLVPCLFFFNFQGLF